MPKRVRVEDAVQWCRKQSPLAFALLQKWASGRLSAPDLQQLALAAVQTGIEDESVQELASLGARGRHPQNIQRDLLKLAHTSLVPPSIAVTCARLDPKSNAVDVGQVPMKLPAQWMEMLCCRSLLFDSMFGTERSLKEFWQQARPEQDPRLRDSPLLKKRNWQQRCVPLLLHGDAASFQNYDSLMTISFRGLLSAQAGMQDHLWICSFPKSVTAPGEEGTMHALWSWISWSLQALFDNVWPATDPWGRSLASDPMLGSKIGKPVLPNGFFAVLYGYMGDMDEFQKSLGTRHQASDMPCHLCGCNRTDVPWNDFSSAAKWRSSGAGCQKDLSHPIFKAPGVSIHSLCLDVLHVLDLGVTAHVIGNVFLAYVLRGARAAQFRTLWSFIQEHQRQSEHGKPLSTFALSNFTNPKAISTTYPCLQHLKAAQVRCLVPVALRLALAEFRDDEDIQQVTKNLNLFYTFLYESNIVPTAAQANSGFKSLNRMLQSYQRLAARAVEEGKCMWSMVPKHHYSAELCKQGRYLNPRFCWTYGSEDYVGSIAELGSSCLKGCPTFHMPFGLVEKLDVGLTLELALRL